jgi:hypothetical protein
MHCWVGESTTDTLLSGKREDWVREERKWTARWKWAKCAAGRVGQEMGNGSTAGWEREVDCWLGRTGGGRWMHG